MLSARVRTIIISDPGATAYIIINILVATRYMCFTCARYVCTYTTVREQRFVCLRARACMQQRTMGAWGRGWSSRNGQKEKPYLHTEPPYIMWNGYFAIYRVFVIVSKVFLSIYSLRWCTMQSLQLNGSMDQERSFNYNSTLTDRKHNDNHISCLQKFMESSLDIIRIYYEMF